MEPEQRPLRGDEMPEYWPAATYKVGRWRISYC